MSSGVKNLAVLILLLATAVVQAEDPLWHPATAPPGHPTVVMSRPTPLSSTQPARNIGQPQFGKIPVTTWAPIAEVRGQIGEAEGSQASNWGSVPISPTNRYFEWHSSRQEGTTPGSLVDSPYLAPGVASHEALLLTVPKVEASPIGIPGDPRLRVPGTTNQPKVGPIPVSAWRAIPIGENNNPNLRSGGQYTETRFFSRTDLQPVVAVSGPAPATSPQPILGPPRPIPAPPPVPDVLASCECVAGKNSLPDLPSRFSLLFAPSLYADADFLLWWTKAGHLPPLVTTDRVDAATFIPGANPNLGALSSPTAQVLIGNSNVGGAATPGGRFLLGGWLLDEHRLGLEVGGFFLGQQSENDSATAFGNELLARPVQDASNGWREIGLQSIAPPTGSGSISVGVTTSLWGLDAAGRSRLWDDSMLHLDVLAGYRLLGLDETLTISQQGVNAGTAAQMVGGVLTPGRDSSVSSITDRFAVHNQFNGGRLAFEGGLTWNAWTVDLHGGLSLGNTSQRVDITGGSVLSGPGVGTTVYPVGLLASSSNIGSHNHSAFSVVPEFGLRVKYRLTEHIQTYAGYDLLYWNNVLRAGDQVDRVINLAQIPVAGSATPGIGSPARPAVTYTSSDFWAQGISIGLEINY